MARTKRLIASTVLGSNAASVTFSSLPQTFDDLVILSSARSQRTPASSAQLGILLVQPNGLTTGLSQRYMAGSGSSTFSSTDTTWGISITPDDTSNWTASTFASVEIYIPNYAGSASKTMAATTCLENNATASYIYAIAGLRSSTDAITSLVISGGTHGIKSGSSFQIYGIKHS